jgi:hypothetical protein
MTQFTTRVDKFINILDIQHKAVARQFLEKSFMY